MSLVNKKKMIKITQSYFTNVRDLLIDKVFINNGHRSGVLKNMAIQEYGTPPPRDVTYLSVFFCIRTHSP